MDIENFHALRNRVLTARRGQAVLNREEVPLSVSILEGELKNKHDALSRYTLYQLLREEWFHAGRPDLELATLRRCVSDLCEEPLPLITLAEALKDDVSGLVEATQVAKEAVCKGRSTNRFVRLALGVQARVAARSEDYKLLAWTLEVLIQESEIRRAEDGPYDVDFLEGLPEGAVSTDLQSRYLAIARPRALD